MNCRDIEPLLLAEKDGVLTNTQHASLEQHVATCPACRQMRTRLTEAMAAVRADAATVSVPDVDAEWHTLRACLHRPPAQPEKKNPLAPVLWFGAPLAAAAALAFAFFIDRSPSSHPAEFSQVTEGARADFVEAGNADASTMVYVDKESGWLVVWATDTSNGKNG